MRAEGWKTIAIDGKAYRSAAATFSGCLHGVSAWATDNGLSLAQVAVEDGSHEIATIPEVLKLLDLKGALVTIDAAGCQKAIAQQIRDQKGEYVLAVGLPAGWPDVAAVVQVNRERAVKGKRTSPTHYYVTSVRVDAVFGEDGNRTRDRNAGVNLGVVRRVAVSLLKQDSKRGGMHGKRLKATLNEHYLEQALRGFNAH